MLKMLIPGAVAGVLLLGASDAKACCTNVSLWVNVGVESTSNEVFATETLCMPAASQIIDQGFRFQTSTQIQPRLTGLFFTKNGNGNGAGGSLATLFCAANVAEERLD